MTLDPPRTNATKPTYTTPHGPAPTTGSLAASIPNTGDASDAGLESSLNPGRNDPLHVSPPSYERDMPIHASAAAASSGSASCGFGRPIIRASTPFTALSM